MRKILKSVIVIMLALMLTLACACGESSWNSDNVTLKDGGNVISANGFVAETEHYVYFINGKGDSTTDNKFGTPVKGSLMAMKKSDMEKPADEIEQCIVVPKLFVASDYTSGLFFHDGYVYYGTPTTDKDSSGTAANTELEFMRTKLDGSGATDRFFKTGALSDVYRFVEKDGVVYVVVYDSANSQIISYNTATAESKVIVEKDDKTESSETLDSYNFVDVENAGEVAVVYTTKVFTADYNESEAEFTQYVRPTADYNKVYVYKVGDAESKLVLDGTETNSTFALTLVKGEYVYYTQTKAVSINSANTYAISLSDLYQGNKATIVTKADYVADANLIVSLDEVYLATENSGVIKKSTITGDVTSAEAVVAKVSTVSKLLFKDGDYMYYINSNSYIARIKISNVDEENEADLAEQIISDSTVATDWYKVEKIGDYVFYSDNTEAGCSYIKFVNVGGNPVVDEGEDDGHGHDHEHTYAFENQKQIGKVAESDMLVYTNAKLTAIADTLENGALLFDTYNENEAPTNALVEEVRALYENLTDDQKEEFDASNLEILEKYEMALKVSRAFYKLVDFDKLSTADKDAKRVDYDAAKAVIDELKASDFDYAVIRNLVENNLNWYYQTATEYFA